MWHTVLQSNVESTPLTFVLAHSTDAHVAAYVEALGAVYQIMMILIYLDKAARISTNLLKIIDCDRLIIAVTHIELLIS